MRKKVKVKAASRHQRQSSSCGYNVARTNVMMEC